MCVCRNLTGGPEIFKLANRINIFKTFVAKCSYDLTELVVGLPKNYFTI